MKKCLRVGDLVNYDELKSQYDPYGLIQQTGIGVIVELMFVEHANRMMCRIYSKNGIVIRSESNVYKV